MNILLKPYSGEVYKKNKIFFDNNGDNIFYGVKDEFSKIGHNINTVDIKVEGKIDSIVFCDAPLPWEIEYWKILLKYHSKAVLFCIESPMVNPFSHMKFTHHLFRKVYTWNDKLVDNKKIFKFNLPALNTNLDVKEIAFQKKKLICVVNSNKAIPAPFLMLSPYKSDLYPQRIKVINNLEKMIPDQFDLYGRGWNLPKKFSVYEKIFGFKKYKTYKGAIPRDASSKINTISKYKFNLCFENCVADGYISEKIIDCLKASTVPIYYGAPNIEKYIPKNCFIDYRNFESIEDLVNFITNMDERTYNTYIINGKKLLKNEEFKKNWFVDGFYKTLLNAAALR